MIKILNQTEIHKKAHSKDVNDRIKAGNELLKIFSNLPDEEEAWKDLILLLSDPIKIIRLNAEKVIVHVYPQIKDKNQAYEELRTLLLKMDNELRIQLLTIINQIYQYIPNKQQASHDIDHLKKPIFVNVKSNKTFMGNYVDKKTISLLTVPSIILFLIFCLIIILFIPINEKILYHISFLCLIFLSSSTIYILFKFRIKNAHYFLLTLKQIANLLPTINQSKDGVPTHNKLLITLLAIIGYFILRAIPIYGLLNNVDIFNLIRGVWLGSSGTFTTLGIGHILIASSITSIVLNGRLSGIILANPLRISNEEYLDFKKFISFYIAIILTIIISFTYSQFALLIILQILFGGIIITYIVELIDMKGVGNGIIWLIIAETSFKIFWHSFSPIKYANGYEGDALNFFVTYEIVYLLPIILTTIFLLISIYLASSRILIPLAHSTIKYARSSYSIPLISFGDEIIFGIINLISILTLTAYIFDSMGFPLLGSFSNLEPSSGIIYYLTPPNIYSDDFKRFLIFAFIFIIYCIFKSIYLTFFIHQTPFEISNSLLQSGWQIPGFRRTIQSMQIVFVRYFFRFSILNGFIVAILFIISIISGPFLLEGGVGLLMIAIYFSGYTSNNISKNIKDHAIESINYLLEKGFESIKNNNENETRNCIKNLLITLRILNFLDEEHSYYSKYNKLVRLSDKTFCYYIYFDLIMIKIKKSNFLFDLQNYQHREKVIKEKSLHLVLLYFASP